MKLFFGERRVMPLMLTVVTGFLSFVALAIEDDVIKKQDPQHVEWEESCSSIRYEPQTNFITIHCQGHKVDLDGRSEMALFASYIQAPEKGFRCKLTQTEWFRRSWTTCWIPEPPKPEATNQGN